MNKVVTIVLFLAGAILLLITPYQVFAQTSDTVIVYASMYGPAISQEINFDQANHPNAHRVYVLQQKGIIDTIYYTRNHFPFNLVSPAITMAGLLFNSKMKQNEFIN